MKTKVYVIKRKPNETTQDVVLRTLKLITLKDIFSNSEKKNLDKSKLGNLRPF